MSSVQIKITLDGLDKLRAKLLANAPKVRPAVKAELYQFAEEVMAISKERVPVLTGALMNTGKVMPPTEDGTVVSVVMGYGDESAPYALYVHEALEGQHPINPDWSWAKAAAAGKTIQWTRPGSGPKYLENPVKENQDKLPERIVRVYKDTLLS